MSNAAINLSTLNANTVLASTFSQAAYPSASGTPFVPPAGFTKVTFEFAGRKSVGFAAETYVNKATGEVVIAYRGSDNVGEAVGVAAKSASTGTWDPQFTDATNYAKQAQTAALKTINDYRDETGKPRLTANNITPLVTGHSLGGLLGQVVSKMFGWPAEVFDSLGGGKLVTTQEFADQAKALGQVDTNGNVINHDVSDKITNYATSGASSVGTQLGSTVNIPALGQVGGMGAVASMLAFVMSPIAAGLSLLTQQEIAQHGKFAIEQAMYGLAALKPLVSDQGALQAQNMTMAQATGQSVSDGGTSPNVVALVNAQGQVVAYVGRDGNTPQIVVTRGANAGTTLNLGRTSADENAPIEIIQTNPDRSQKTLNQESLLSSLKAAGKDVISSQVFDDGSRIETTTTAGGKQTTTTYDSNGAVFNRSELERSTNTEGETWLRQEFDSSGKLIEVQTAVYDSKKGLTEVDVYRDGALIGHSTIQGQATQAQLDRALNLSEQLANATSFAGAGKSDSGESFVDTLNILDAQQTAQLTAGVGALSFADTQYSGSNVASAPVFSTVADYSKWLVGRGTQVSVRNDIEADPSLLGLQDGALTVALARQNPNPVNVMRALQSVILAGGVLSESFKQSVADQLGTNTANVNTWVASGGAAITSFLVAMDKPTVANVTGAALSMLNAGIVFDPALKQVFADKLGFTGPSAINDFSNMLAYGGAGLAVAAMLKDPTPQNIVGATQQVTGMLGAMNGSASLQNLSYSLGNATAVFSVYNFAKNPSKQTAVSAMLSVAMRMPSLAPYAVPLAAALTIGELVIPGFTDKAVNALVHDIPGVAFDVTKNVIKVEVSLLKGALNLAGSVVETVGGVVNSVGNVVANTVTSVVNTVTNVAKKVWGKITPLVVNLADDPVHTTTLTKTSPLFDMSGDGVKERTGWITADEGFLVRDPNGNGKIDSINEMFSERTSTIANSAFGALAELDSNKDGVISNTDANWSTLKVWVDKNSDGTTQANELYTLAQLGIASIKLNPTKNFAYDNGNVIGDKSTFTYTDGRVGEIADAIFTTQDASITQNVSQSLITQDSTTVRLSNGQTMKVLDVHGKTLMVGSVTEGINIVTSTGGNTLTAADDANGLVLMGETGDTLNAGKGHLVTLVSNGGAKLVGNTEDNLYVVSQTTDVIVEAVNAGVDTVRSSASYTLSANLENLTLTGTTVIGGTGNALNNTMTGNSANNVLDGGAGIDTLVGGAGNDTYVVDMSTDVIIESASEGVDTVQSSVSYSLANLNNVENLTLTGSIGINGTGNALANTLIGNSANNVLDGGAGNDILNGGVGGDTLKGGLGDDTYVVDSMTDSLIENANEGTDTVQASVSHILNTNLENLTLTGTAAINGTGNALNNYIIGNTANNFLYGNDGADWLDGGAGNDYLYGASGNDTYVFGRGSGQDYVCDYNSSSSAASSIDVVQLGAGIGASDVVVTRDQNNLYLSIAGTTDKLALSNWFSGDSCRIEQVRFADGAVWDANTLIAKSNLGTTGSDYLVGTTGADRLAGLAGNDTYVMDNAGDVVVENAYEGADTVNASVSYTLVANVENLYLQGNNAINATGNELSNALYGNIAANTLDGGAGNDFLNGTSGNDTYVFGRGSGQDYVLDFDNTVGNVDIVQLGAGIGASDVVVTRDICNLYLSIAGTTDNLTMLNWFSDDAYRIEKVRFANGTVWDENTLVVKKNVGTSDADDLAGTTGADLLAGLEGNDSYVVDNAGDVVVENANEGTDTVNASVSYTLAANVENLYLQGSNAINATGNELSNTLYGSDIANTLDGGAGNDYLYGASGNDTYLFGRGYGQDTVYDCDTIPGNVDTLQLGAGIASDQLWFKRMSNDLEVSIIGSDDKARIRSWYSGRQNQVEKIKVAGKSLLNTDVQKLVQAMASFAAPASGQTTLPTNYQTTLAPVIAANWH